MAFFQRSSDSETVSLLEAQSSGAEQSQPYGITVLSQEGGSTSGPLLGAVFRGSSSRSESPPQPILLQVKNTFLEVIPDEPTELMPRSNSWSVSSSTGSSSTGSTATSSANSSNGSGGSGSLIADDLQSNIQSHMFLDSVISSSSVQAPETDLLSDPIISGKALIEYDEEDENQEERHIKYGWSIGAAEHDAPNGCKPCVFLLKPKTGCQNGTECPFCHLEHEHRPRPSKAKRVHWKEIVNKIIAKQSRHPERLKKQCLKLAAGNEYLQRYMLNLPELQGLIQLEDFVAYQQAKNNTSSSSAVDDTESCKMSL